jgi:hypothetical protein
MLTEVPLIGETGECAWPAGVRGHVMVGARGGGGGRAGVWVPGTVVRDGTRWVQVWSACVDKV